MKRVYLDNNATTIVDPQVKDAMDPFYCQMYGNPNSLHSFGTEVHPYMRIALDRLYEAVGAGDEDDVIVNSCATEGNNTVLKGVWFDVIRNTGKKRVITSQVEHPSIAAGMRFLESLGAEIVLLPPNEDGIIDPERLKDELDPDTTALVSIMWANNETGLINPVKEIGEVCKERGVLFHTDAVQAVGKIPVNLKEVPADFLTISAHKFHGPKGVGALYIRKGVHLTPMFHGGEQMGEKRAGTIDVPGFIGIGTAARLAVDNLDYEAREVRRLRDKLEDAILALPGTEVIGRREIRTPNTILASFHGIEGEAFIWDLNQHGIGASTGSACASESLEPNPTFIAMGVDDSLAHTGVRLSLSRFTTEEEIDYTIDVIDKTVRRLRSISMVPAEERDIHG